jgi:hypothetical protein
MKEQERRPAWEGKSDGKVLKDKSDGQHERKRATAAREDKGDGPQQNGHIIHSLARGGGGEEKPTSDLRNCQCGRKAVPTRQQP